MEEPNQQQIEELLKKIDRLMQQQQQLQNEIIDVKKSVSQLSTKSKLIEPIKPIPEIDVAIPVKENIVQAIVAVPELKKIEVSPVKIKKEKTPLEEFIGTNLLNKIGIVILVLGISYGVKYSIDHNLIDPITRVVLGYLSGLILIGVAIKLKVNYKTFSAVLLSGGMASLYFITYAAYDFYDLFPLGLAFTLMVLFTAFTVYAAMVYDQKVIAIFGLVGAYGVPFLLSDGSGKVAVLFSYITIVNLGILMLAFRKAWKQLYYIAFGLTWFIFAAWYVGQFSAQKYLWTSLIFSTLFFATFYVTFLAYKLIQKEAFKRWDIAMLLLNSFIYFGFGYAAIDQYENGELFLGLFTVFNAVLHFIACAFVYKKTDVPKETFYFVAGMVLVFLTLAVPVQLNGNWVTLIWSGEAALLFWIGRTKTFPVFERLSYVLILLATGSLLDDWGSYNHYAKNSPELYIRFFINVHFLSSVLVLSAFGWILKLNFDKKFSSSSDQFQSIFTWAFSGIFLLLLYLSVYLEISTYWNQHFIDSEVMVYSGHGYDPYPIFNNDLKHFRTIWLLVYSSLFGIALSMANKHLIKNNTLVIVCTAFNALILFNFLVVGLVSFTDLRNHYLQQTDVRFYFRDFNHILIRYVSYLFVLPLVWINRQHIKNAVFSSMVKKIELVLLHVFILTVLSSELVHWLEMARVHESFKLGLSILWGSYALMLIIVGLKNQNKELRVMAMVLFAVTVFKLFVYDMANMSTIAKTIVMIILGVLMLVASFLYNKVKKPAEDEMPIDKTDPKE